MQSYILDTCTFLWLTSDPHLIPKEALESLAAPDNQLYLSAASVWELGIKNGSSSFTLSHPLEEFVKSALDSYNLELLQITPDACAQLKRLPTVHRDPFDRMLICQAIVTGAILVTPDIMIWEYPVRTLWS